MFKYSSTIQTSLIPCTILCRHSQSGRDTRLDTGAITDNFINRGLAEELISQGSVIISKSVIAPVSRSSLVSLPL
jgi:hypothetical protein